MTSGRHWPQVVAALIAGLALGASSFAAGALLLYAGEGFLASAGFLAAVAFLAAGAGLWTSGPDRALPGHGRALRRWTFAVIALIIASFVATFWLRSPGIQATPWGGPLVMVLLLAEPAYAMGALFGAMSGRRRTVGVPALAGIGAGAVLAGGWLIPAFPPGLVFLGLALLLTAAGSIYMGFSPEKTEESMSDRVVVVTGVGDPGQLGYALAEAFVSQGARVVVTSRSATIHDRAAALGAEVVSVAADLADEAGAEAVVEAARSRWGRLDVLVNVAGGLHVMKSVRETSPEEWEREVASNARTAFLVSRAALPLLRESRGAIVNFASPAGVRAVKGMAAYSAGKAGVVALTRSLAMEERDSGVRVNAVAPGMMDTGENRAQVEDPESHRWVTREEVVDVVLFLAGPSGAGVNGETVAVLGRTL